MHDQTSYYARRLQNLNCEAKRCISYLAGIYSPQLKLVKSAPSGCAGKVETDFFPFDGGLEISMAVSDSPEAARLCRVLSSRRCTTS